MWYLPTCIHCPYPSYMKLPIAIVIGCIIIAVAMFLGLTYDKRTWMASCTSGNELFLKDQTTQTCELQYVKSRK
ncbi:hypothetical protein SAMN04515619_11732 [Collimonas sp. OK412]|nr:hypothetical protein SAMN04515619_11732 [Collimonas sp. OK412]